VVHRSQNHQGGRDYAAGRFQELPAGRSLRSQNPPHAYALRHPGGKTALARAVKDSAMTEFLFRGDSYLREATAKVVAITPEGGIVLDRTNFYAASGGQPGDSGT